MKIVKEHINEIRIGSSENPLSTIGIGGVMVFPTFLSNINKQYGILKKCDYWYVKDILDKCDPAYNYKFFDKIGNLLNSNMRDLVSISLQGLTSKESKEIIKLLRNFSPIIETYEDKTYEDRIFEIEVHKEFVLDKTIKKSNSNMYNIVVTNRTFRHI